MIGEVFIIDRRDDYVERLADHFRKAIARERDNVFADHYARIHRGEAVQARVNREPLTLARLLAMGRKGKVLRPKQWQRA